MIEELGSGGMATVYRARDRELRREVAIKVLFPHLCKNREVVARFQREARAAAGLDHPHILRVFDVGGGGEGGGDPPYIVLELVRGPSLAEIVEGGALIAELAAACGVALASALAHAHAAGVIHRDIKPGNVLVAEGGRLVLADFGVARVAEDDSSLVTRTGALLGTPAFMSPEQATGAPLDARSDLYSVGATLYQLATGSLPVSGNPARVVAAIVAGDVVAPLRRNPAMGRDLAQVIERLMALEPAARLASAAELEAGMRAIVAAGDAGDPDALLAEMFADRAACEARLRPIVVAATVARAKKAVAEDNAARALGLCDRALALDASCHEASEIAQGIGKRRLWGRVAVGGAIAVVVAGGAVAAWTMWPAGDGEKTEVAAGPAVVTDAAATEAPVADKAPPIDIADAARASDERADAGGGDPRTGEREPKKKKKVTATEAVPPPPVRVDAAPPVEKTPDRPPADARLTVEMDTWCQLSVDREAKGQLTKRLSVTVRPGRREIACYNSELAQTWRKTVDLAPGETRTLTGTLLPELAVVVSLSQGEAVRIDKGKVVSSGATARLKRGTHRIEIMRGGEVIDSRYLGVSAACTLRDRPEISCITH